MNKKKAKYCVGLNCHEGNIEILLAERGKDIYEVYAPCPASIGPTGRITNNRMDLRILGRHINLAHSYGVRYNILLNGSCFGGREFNPAYQKKVADFVRRIDDLGADSITVMNPFLIDLARRASARIEIIASSFTEVIEPVKIERLRSRGASRAVLHQNVYRNFNMLKKIREGTDMPLEIIPNQGCINQCDSFISHINLVAHSSVASKDELKHFGKFDFPIRRCRYIRQTNPIEFLMSCFIRPEDLGIYEKMGFNIFKFAGRRSSTEWMLNVLSAYINRSYEGNLFDLSSHVGESAKICNLPNKVLDGWFEYMGSNSDNLRFRRKAISFSRAKRIGRYFGRKG